MTVYEGGARRRRRTRQRTLVALAALVALALVGAGTSLWYVQRSIGQIPKFEAGEGAESPLELAPAVATEPETFLVFSTGSAGVDPNRAKDIGVTKGRLKDSDNLTDTLMLIVVNPTTNKAAVLSVPRDLWSPKYGSKINAVYLEHGARALTQEVEDITGLSVNHLVSLNFEAFSDLTNAIGGVSLDFPVPVRDEYSGLQIDKAGCTSLSGAQALQLVRSRHWQVKTGGHWHSDPTSSDFGRIKRQQIFLRAVMAKMLNPSLVTQVPTLLGVAKDNLTIDKSLKMVNMLALARALKGTSAGSVEMYQIPGTDGWVGSQSVVFRDKSRSAQVVSKVKATLASKPAAAKATTPATHDAAGPKPAATPKKTTSENLDPFSTSAQRNLPKPC